MSPMLNQYFKTDKFRGMKYLTFLIIIYYVCQKIYYNKFITDNFNIAIALLFEPSNY